MLIAYKCTGCAAPLSEPETPCLYCGTKHTLKLPQNQTAITNSKNDRAWVSTWVVGEKRKLQQEKVFLLEQVEITGHPSLRRKIELVEKKMQNVLNLETSISKQQE